MKIKEIKANELDTKKFIETKIKEIKKIVRDDFAITALSGGIDSSVTTTLGKKALGDRLKVCFVDNGLMRQNEPQKVVSLFKGLGIFVEIIDARKEFFDVLKGITDPEKKRKAILQTFYKKVFGKAVKESRAKYLLQGTIFTDVEETVAGIKSQHNVLEQMGINSQEAFGYKVIEPLMQLRKDGVRKVAKTLRLPESIYNKMPFPGPALAVRVVGEVTPEKIDLIRKATVITEEVLAGTGAFQYMAILNPHRVTGVREGNPVSGRQIEIRCWESTDAKTAKPTRVPHRTSERLAERITAEILEVVSVTYNMTSKPPSTMETM